MVPSVKDVGLAGPGSAKQPQNITLPPSCSSYKRMGYFSVTGFPFSKNLHLWLFILYIVSGINTTFGGAIPFTGI